MDATLRFSSPVVLSGHEAAIYALAPWKGGILSGGGDGKLVAWQPERHTNGKLVAQVPDRIFSMLSLKHTGGSAPETLVVGTLSGDLFWVGLAGQQGEAPSPPRRWRFHEDGVFALSQVGKQVFVGGGGGKLSRWSIQTGEMLGFAEVDTVRLRSMVHLPHLELLAVGTANGDIHLVDLVNLRIVHTIAQAHELTVFALGYMPELGLLVSAGRDGALRTWQDRAPFAQRGHAAAHGSTINALSMQAASGLVASAGRDREVRIWRISNGQPVLAKALVNPRDGGHVASVNACCWAGQALVSGGDDRTLRYWKSAELG